MIKVHLPTLSATRESLPAFLKGLQSESLLNLDWTDPALGVREYGWWPETNNDPPIDSNTQQYGAETLTASEFWKLVTVTHAVEALSPEAIAEKIATAKTERTAELASIRYQHETAGITLNGATIETNRESQALVNGAYSYSLLNPAVLIDWKATTGWIQIDATMIAGIATAVACHVQDCFSNERTLSEAIAAAESVDAVQQIDLTIGWP
jgi:hypothetical protein